MAKTSARQEAEAEGAASKIPAALGGIGLATASTAIALATCQPPPGFDNSTCYILTLSVAFLAGVTQVGASVWVYDDIRGRRAAGKKFLYASIPPVVVAVGLSVVSLLW